MTAKTADACPNATSNQLDHQAQIKRIRVFNDSLRKYGWGGKVLITQGVMAQGLDFAKQALKAVQAFDSFSDANDPWGEHDFGAVCVHGQRVLWKVDYHDRTATFHSPDPSDNKLTLRVLTIMLSEEY